MSMRIDRIGGATYSGGAEWGCAVRPASLEKGLGLQGGPGLTVTKPNASLLSGAVGLEAEPTRDDELTPILSRYSYPPPPMPEGLKG